MSGGEEIRDRGDVGENNGSEKEEMVDKRGGGGRLIRGRDDEG
jgi:hypothetical protein